MNPAAILSDAVPDAVDDPGGHLEQFKHLAPVDAVPAQRNVLEQRLAFIPGGEVIPGVEDVVAARAAALVRPVVAPDLEAVFLGDGPLSGVQLGLVGVLLGLAAGLSWFAPKRRS